MKKNTLLVFLLICLSGKAQKSDVKGIVSLHNSAVETGRREYVKGAIVTDDFDSAQGVITNVFGQFHLLYVLKACGTKVYFSIRKPNSNLEVVNITELSAITGQADTVRISMAPKGKIADIRKKIYKVGITSAEYNLKNNIEEKLRTIKTLMLDSTTNATRILNLTEKIALLEKQRTQIADFAAELAERYSPINLDDASPLVKDAFSLFQHGYLDSALLILKNLDLSFLVYNILQEREQISKLKRDLVKRDSIVMQRDHDVEEALIFKADLHKVRYEFDSVSSCFKLLLKLDSNNIENLWNYADYLAWLNKYDTALNIYSNILIAVKVGKWEDNPKICGMVSSIENDLGHMYKAKHNFKMAEYSYLEALRLVKVLEKLTLQDYGPHLSKILNNLGELYYQRRDFPRSEKFYLQALEIKNNYLQNNSSLLKYSIVATKSNMGNLYCDMNELDKAPSYSFDCLKTIDSLNKNNDEKYNLQSGWVKNNLGRIYQKRKIYDSSEMYFREALSIFYTLEKKNKDSYYSDLAMVENNIGNLFVEQGEYDLAQSNLINSLSRYRELDFESSGNYDSEIARGLNNLGALCLYQVKYDSSELCYLQALRIRYILDSLNSGAFLADIAMIESGLGNLYQLKRDPIKAKTYLLPALKSYQKLASESFQAYNLEILHADECLGVINDNLHLKLQSDSVFSHGDYLCNKLVNIDSSTYQLDFAYFKYTLGNHYLFNNEIIYAKTAFEMAIKAYKKIKSKWPNRFLAYSLNNLSHVYLKLTDQRDAEESMLDDFKVREKLQERYPNEFTETVNALAKYLLALYLIKLDSFGYKEYDQDLLSKFNYIEPRLKYIANSNDSVRKVLVQFYGRNSWFLLFARKYNMAVEMAEKALKIDSTQPWIRLNLANALLFDNQFDRAILMYKAFKTDKQNTNNEFEKNCNKDFDEFERHGITNKYIPIIREFLNN